MKRKNRQLLPLLMPARRNPSRRRERTASVRTEAVVSPTVKRARKTTRATSKEYTERKRKALT